MREDMYHLLVERSRTGASSKSKRHYRAQVRLDPEAYVPTGMKKLHSIGYGNKELNENLNPLFRFIDKQVGRKWNDVYSEICQHINGNSAVQYHVLQHLSWHVHIDNVIIIDGIPCDSATYSPFHQYKYAVYVDPNDGILKRVPKRNYNYYHNNNKSNNENRINDKNNSNIQYHRINGIWFELECVNIKIGDNHRGQIVSYYKTNLYDVGYKDYIDYDKLSSRYGKKMIAISKRQLNKKEIQQLISHKNLKKSA